MSKSRRKVLAIQNIHCETLGGLGKMLGSDGFEIEHLNAQEEDLPKTTSGYAAVVILGGPMAVYDHLDYIDKEIALVKNGLKNKTPMLGICLGSQIVAQAAGGNVFKGSKKEIGWYKVSLSYNAENDIFYGIPSGKELQVFQWHGDTYKLPKEARVLAYSNLYPQAFRIGSAIGIQFHLEVNKEMVQNWVKEYHAELDSEKILANHILSGREDDFRKLNITCQKVYSNFSKTVAKSSMKPS